MILFLPFSAMRNGRSARGHLALLLGLSACLSGVALRGQAVVPYVELGAGYRQGTFGLPIQSTLWAGYTTYGASGSRWDANLTVPYLSLKREGEGLTSRDQGLGDVVARGTWRFVPETEDGWSLDGMGAVKLPTASDTQGLGTGRLDAGAFLALNQQLGLLRWSLLGGWIQGASTIPAGTSEELTSGTYVFNLGAALLLDGNRWGISLEARGPLLKGLPGAREISLNGFHPLSSKWGLKGYLTVGLSDGGPKRSAGLALLRIFP